MPTDVNGTSSSSATICVKAVSTPVPSSTWPLKTVMRPFPSIASHASTDLKSFGPERVACPSASVIDPAKLKPTTSAPPVFRNCLRVTANGAVMSHLSRRVHHGLDNARVSTTAAQVAGKRAAYIVFARPRIPVEKGLGRHDHAVDAVAALRCLRIDERLLNPVRPPGGPEPFERRHRLATDGGQWGDARAHGLTVDDHGARPALAETAAEARASEAEVVAQDVEQRRVRFGFHRPVMAVDSECERLHRVSSLHPASPLPGARHALTELS